MASRSRSSERSTQSGTLSSSVEKHFGLELFFNSCKDSFTSKTDALVLLVHYLLVRSGKRCAGTGTEWPPSITSSEMLPNGWNANQPDYTLRYISTSGTERYLLKISRAEGFLLVNVLNVRKEKTAATNFTIDRHVSEDFQNCFKAYSDLDGVINKVQHDIINVLDMESGEPTVSVTSSGQTSRVTSRETNPLHIPSRQPGIEWGALPEPLNVGTSDLNPFVGPGVGGGMLMDPRQIPRPHHSDPGVGFPGLPRGSVPPGARFDPFGPPHPDRPNQPGRFSGTHPDHLPPPPDYDDMFS